MNNSQYDVAIIGGGISGSALLYLLSRYTDLSRITLLEKYDDIAALNSHGRNNSQTLHCGDIETNYTLEKALQVQASAQMLVNYVINVAGNKGILSKYPKMALGVGEQECELLRERFKLFSPHYPGMQLLDHDGIGAIEPNVVKQRHDEVVALALTDQYCAVNFQRLAQSFADQSRKSKDKHIDLKLNTRIERISQSTSGFNIESNNGNLSARFVIVSAGAHSLLFAQQMGYGFEYACLPVAGSFYYTPRLLNGKVYTVQNDKLPFAAIHGDPDVLVDHKTRFGPTALILPMLERYNYKTVPDFFKVFSLESGVLKTLGNLLKVSDVRNYIFKNMLFEVPILRNHLFLKDAQKIVPSLKLKDVHFARRIGGIRPVMIDKQQAKLHLGEAKINPNNGIIFNMTPSPGATSCLHNAEQDLRSVVSHLGCHLNEEMLNQELK